MIAVKKLSLIVPVYKNPKNLSPYTSKVPEIMRLVKLDWEVIFVIDPDQSNKSEIMAPQLNLSNKKFKFIILIRRFGQTTAIQCGLRESTADVYIIMDVDGKDSISLIPETVESWIEGLKIVLPRQLSRKVENYFRLISTTIEYWLLNKHSDMNIPKSIGDFCLIDKRIRDILFEIDYPYYFLRRNIAQIGFPFCLIDFRNEERVSGKSNYPKYLGSLSYAVNAIFGYPNLASTVVLVIVTSFILFIVFVIILNINKVSNANEIIKFLFCILLLLLTIILSILYIHTIRTHDYLNQEKLRKLFNYDSVGVVYKIQEIVKS
jgi:glycosyltransferase involved in cell wall biosynthesis